LKHLAELARIELTEREEEKLLKDLQKILNYFKELQELDTSGVPPMAGGAAQKNSFREDEERSTSPETGRGAFPETENKYLKIPPVFEQ
ncbi:MAG: Asp-tRNA(Asn)/Glu-tRNA(Gln) amidotransferase subunit GatC, partial [Patescibacteria group bacterium]